MKRSFLLLCLFAFCFFSLAAQQEEYTITESELERLEAICRNWESNKHTLQSQVQNLKARLTEALTKSEELKTQLTEAREALKNSEQSLSVYEKEAARQIAEKQAEVDNLKIEKEKLKEKNHRLVIAALVLSAVLAIGILGSLIFIYIKFKTSFLR